MIGYNTTTHNGLSYIQFSIIQIEQKLAFPEAQIKSTHNICMNRLFCMILLDLMYNKLQEDIIILSNFHENKYQRGP